MILLQAQAGVGQARRAASGGRVLSAGMRADSAGSGGASPTRAHAPGGVYKAGGVLWDGLQADALRLKLVRWAFDASS